MKQLLIHKVDYKTVAQLFFLILIYITYPGERLVYDNHTRLFNKLIFVKLVLNGKLFLETYISLNNFLKMKGTE